MNDIDLNPYAAPQIPADPEMSLLDELSARGGAWRQQKLVVTTRQAVLPALCVKTGEPAARHEIVQLTWYPSWALVSVLLGPLFFIPLWFWGCDINLAVPIGPTLVRRRRRRLIVAYALMAIALGSAAIGWTSLWGNDYDQLLGIVGSVGFVLSLILAGNISAPLLRIRHADQRFVWLAGAGDVFLASLPNWPGR